MDKQNLDKQNLDKPDKETTTNHPDRKLLEMLVCPLTKKPLEYDREAGELISKEAQLAYPIKQGIPIMIDDVARKLED